MGKRVLFGHEISGTTANRPTNAEAGQPYYNETLGRWEVYDGASWVNPSGDVSLVKVKKLAISATPTGAEQDTAFDLPAKAVVLDVWVDVTTAEATGATKTLNVGLLSTETGGDTDGFLAAVSVAATGVKKGTLASTGQTLGALLRVDESGAGALVPEPHVVGTAKSVVYQAGSNDWAEFRGNLYVTYIEIA